MSEDNFQIRMKAKEWEKKYKTLTYQEFKEAGLQLDIPPIGCVSCYLDGGFTRTPKLAHPLCVSCYAFWGPQGDGNWPQQLVDAYKHKMQYLRMENLLPEIPDRMDLEQAMIIHEAADGVFTLLTPDGMTYTTDNFTGENLHGGSDEAAVSRAAVETAKKLDPVIYDVVQACFGSMYASLKGNINFSAVERKVGIDRRIVKRIWEDYKSGVIDEMGYSL